MDKPPFRNIIYVIFTLEFAFMLSLSGADLALVSEIIFYREALHLGLVLKIVDSGALYAGWL